MSTYIKWFRETGKNDIALVGGKNAALGELFSELSKHGILVPDGFAVTTTAFTAFLDLNGLAPLLQHLMNELDREQYKNLETIGAQARRLLMHATLPPDLVTAIQEAYRTLAKNGLAVAVRSSATAEDLPDASFAGQHESYLHIKGEKEVVAAMQRCFASLYTNRAIKYREDHGFAHEKVALSVGVQHMVRADKGCSGVAFTLDPETGFRGVIQISGVWGLGETLVQGTVTPDEFWVFKPTLQQGKNALLQKRLGSKSQMMVYQSEGASPTKLVETPEALQARFVLTDEEITQLAQWCSIVEQHFGRAMDIEWAKDGRDHHLYLLQARPETVQSDPKSAIARDYVLLSKATPLISGQAVGHQITTGTARVLSSISEASSLQPGDIVVTPVTTPDWDPFLKGIEAIVTDRGGRTSHAAIVARELGIPAVVGCERVTSLIQEGDAITVSCAAGQQGHVFAGLLPFQVVERKPSEDCTARTTKALLILGDPDQAFKYSFYPSDGVGLMRLEMIITHSIRVHPMALAQFDKVASESDRAAIEKLTAGYSDKRNYFIDRLSQAISTVAAAFYPRPVIVRTSDFKTNEYAHLLGGSSFEPQEENPMIGFRGASRYYHELYQEGFALECAALRKVRGEMGLDNIKVMIPFCRTVEEGRRVIHTMAENGLDRDIDTKLEIYMMAEIPGNVLLADQFAALFDGFSIGSNDLTQLTLGIDRDSQLVSPLFDEKNEAVRVLIAQMIERAHEAGVPVGLCGQAPSDDTGYAQFLVQKGIDSISFTPDALLAGLENIRLAEAKLAHQEENQILSF